MSVLRGYAVLRYTQDEIERDPDSVLTEIVDLYRKRSQAPN